MLCRSLVRALCLVALSATAAPGAPADTVRVDAEPGAGFHWPYYLLVPEELERNRAGGASLSVLIITNNSGKPSDDLSFHEEDVVRRMDRDYRGLAESLGVAVLSPVFPRPASHAQVYTHALDRDSLVTELAGLERLDLQVAAMQDHAARRLAARGWRVNPKALLVGFSASGMFANRFTMLHPERCSPRRSDLQAAGLSLRSRAGTDGGCATPSVSPTSRP